MTKEMRGAAATVATKVGMAPIVYARGPIVVVESGAEMPARCVRCNASASLPRLAQKLLLVDRTHLENIRLLGMIPIVGRLARWGYRWKHRGKLRKTAAIQLGLCRRHKMLRLFSPLLLLIGIAGAAAILCFGFDAKAVNPLPILGACASFTIGIVLTAWSRHTVRPHQIEPASVSLAAAGRKFVASLPPDAKPAATAASAAALTAALQKRASPPPRRSSIGKE
jgi:hypothetical protein